MRKNSQCQLLDVGYVIYLLELDTSVPAGREGNQGTALFKCTSAVTEPDCPSGL